MNICIDLYNMILYGKHFIYITMYVEVLDALCVHKGFKGAYKHMVFSV